MAAFARTAFANLSAGRFFTAPARRTSRSFFQFSFAPSDPAKPRSAFAGAAAVVVRGYGFWLQNLEKEASGAVVLQQLHDNL